MKANLNKPKPWLIAAWPGMGNVAVIAAGYLVQQLRMQAVGEMPAGDHFDIQQVEVKRGMVMPANKPRGVFYRWDNPGGRDLIVFIGEGQPRSGTHAYAGELMARAVEMGVERIVTFAAVATGLHPTEGPLVFGAATGESTLADLTRAEVRVLEEGYITGLNGVLLGAGMERALPGMCLLAEVPFYAAGVPNAKSARAVLSVFSVISGIEVSLRELSPHIKSMEQLLLKLLENARRQQGGPGEGPGEPEFASEPEASGDDSAEEGAPDEADQSVEPERLERIERLFEAARRDRARAAELKKELDGLGVFERYENRFLDLFKRAA